MPAGLAGSARFRRRSVIRDVGRNQEKVTVFNSGETLPNTSMKPITTIACAGLVLLLLAGCCSPTGYQADAPREYKVLRQQTTDPIQESLQSALNALGREGWTVLQVTPAPHDQPWYTIIVSRPTQ
jgi:hypothetical protein